MRDLRGPGARLITTRVLGVAAAIVGIAIVAIVYTAAPWSGDSASPSEGGERLGFDQSDYGAESAVVWAVGDAADGDPGSVELASVIPDDIDRLLYLGDVYDTGTRAEFEQNYEPLYGRFDDVTSPTIGNHEVDNFERGYRPYWNEVTGGAVPLDYSFKLAGWEIVSLNSEAEPIGIAAQAGRLADEVDEPGTCRLAFWHTPRFSAGFHSDEPKVDPLWEALVGHAAIVLTAHDHNMQRFEPIDGIVQFVSGAGSARELYGVDTSDPRVSFAYNETPAALRLELEPGRATYSVVNVSGDELDSGEIECSPLPPGPS